MRNLGRILTTSLFPGAALLVLLTPAIGIAQNSATGTASVTVEGTAGVAPVDDLVFTLPEDLTIVDLPVQSNLLFGPIAPTGTVAVVTPEPAAEEPAAEETTESGETEAEAGTEAEAEGTAESGETKPNFSANAGSGQTISNLMGTPASVSVSGEANQTYFITLPESTTFSDGVTVFDVSGFNHNAGVTPTIDPQGTGVFNIGATISSQETQQSPISQESSETQDSGDSPVLVAEAPGLEAGIEGPASQSGTEGTASETQGTGSDSSNYSGPVIIGTPFFPVLVSYN